MLFSQCYHFVIKQTPNASQTPCLCGFSDFFTYSNSSADNLNQLFFFHCEQSYYPHSSKNVVLFMSFQIFRAKIEPGKDIYPRFLQLLLYRYNIWLRLSKFNITFQHSHSFSHFSLNLSDICLLVNIK